MVAAFASEYKLATLVGTKTAGRMVATGAFKVGFRVPDRATHGEVLQVAWDGHGGAGARGG